MKFNGNHALSLGTGFLRRCSPSPALDARLLLAYAAHLPADDVPELSCPLAPAVRRRFAQCLRRRAKGEPVARILRRREFWSLPFTISPAVLDPRPDSEILVESALAHFPPDKKSLRVLDLGTGSGALLLAFLSERPHACGVGLDCSREAIKVAQHNAKQLGLAGRTSFVAGDWTAPLSASFDLILANPPYIPSNEIPALAPEVRCFDPTLALDGGADGLNAYRALAPNLPLSLAPKGRIILEAGYNQAHLIKSLLASAGLKFYTSYDDLAGHPRAHHFGLA